MTSHAHSHPSGRASAAKNLTLIRLGIALDCVARVRHNHEEDEQVTPEEEEVPGKALRVLS
jgi:hypothetical protein